MRVVGSVKKPQALGVRSSKAWRLIVFLVIVSVLLFYAISRWDDFALLLSGRNAALPAATGAGSDTAGEDPLIEFKLDREKIEKEQIDMLKAVIDDKDAGKEIRDAARAQYLGIVDAMGKESKIEGLLTARGYESVVFVSPDACTVVVRSKALDEKTVALIGDTARKVTKLSLEKITVIPAP